MSIGHNITDRVKQLKREAVESLYWHSVDIYQNGYVIEESSGISRPGYHLIIENEPCRVSSQIVDPTSDNPKEYFKRIAIMLRPELDIPPGCRFHVYFNDKEEDFKQSSDARKFSDHQTIELIQEGEQLNYA